MHFIFFENMTVIITCLFFFNKSKNLFISKKLDKYMSFFIMYIFSTALTLAAMVNQFVFSGYYFDLRSVPLFFISYIGGWKLGLLASIVPAFYRLNMGVMGANVGIILGMVLPVVMGSLLGKISKNSDYSNAINIKRILSDFLIFIICKVTLMGLSIDIPFKDWWSIASSMIIFWALTLLSIVVIFNDSVKQINSEKELRISEERYRNLVEILPDGVIVYKDDEIIFANKTAAELVDIDDRDKLINLKYKSVSEEDRNIKMLFDKKIGCGSANHKIYLENNVEKDIEIRGTSIVSEGEVYIINIIRDISNTKKNQLLEKKIKHGQEIIAEIKEYDRLKTEFFANLSHELRTPLNLLFSTVQLMELDAKDSDNFYTDKLKKRLKILKQNCSRMVKLTNNLIDITKIDSGYFELSLQDYDIVRITEEITLSVAEYIESNQIELIFDTDVEEKIIPVDLNAMERIILNLLSNAIKFSKPHNQIFVTIQDGGESVSISIKDQGYGIPQDKLNIIFERFRQADRLLNRKQEGSGIGLSLVKSLVNMHGGEIYVESKQGHGSEFIIQLPAKRKGVISNIESIEEFRTSYVESINIEFSDIYSI